MKILLLLLLVFFTSLGAQQLVDNVEDGSISCKKHPPVPEPATYGFFLLGASFAFVLYQRNKDKNTK